LEARRKEVKRYRIAVDIGGTFTDVVLFDQEADTLETVKVLSTHEDLSIGIVAGIERLVSSLADLEFFVHGTTAGINAFLERKGVHTALLTTEGFRDVYEIGRANRPDMYNLFYKKPVPLVRRRYIYEVPERMLYDGTVECRLNEEALEPIIEKLRAHEFASVAVCLLHAYANPEHELLIEEVIKRHLPGVSVSLSHRVAREWREYERTSTTVINAYIAPIIERYLNSLESKVHAGGFDERLHVMESNGGVMTSTAAKKNPIQTLFSGPVGGAIGTAAVGQLLGENHLICIDMGGTSFDVGLVVDGIPDVTTETNLEGFPVLMPIVNIHSIGAGGGSIAWLEAGGLRVGPQSAGSEPGPACYGRGGTEPTVTDANVVLGRVDPDYFAGGDYQLDVDKARLAMAQVAEQLDLALDQLAEGIIDIVNANMANAIRAITVGKGIDPRDFALVAFGGAGPMHAVALAKELQIPRIIVPNLPGTFSAWGMLQTDIRHDLVRTFYQRVSETAAPALQMEYESMEQVGANLLVDEKVDATDMRFVRTADMRYVGQEYFVNIPLPAEIESLVLADLPGRFHQAYLDRYGHSNPEEAIEFVNLRVSAIGTLPKGQASAAEGDLERTEAGPLRQSQAYFGGEWLDTNVFMRDQLLSGQTITGPAIVLEPSCTTVMPPGCQATVDAFGNIEINLDL
jgi:N-methylhydantoinase A